MSMKTPSPPSPDDDEGIVLINANALIGFSPTFDTYRLEQLSEQSASFAESKYIYNKIKQHLQPILWCWNEMLYNAIGVTVFEFRYNIELEKCTCELHYDEHSMDLKNITSATFFAEMKKQLTYSPEPPFADIIHKLIDTVPPIVANNNPAEFGANYLSSTLLYTVHTVIGSHLTEDLNFKKWCEDKQAVFLSTGELWLSKS